MYSGKRSCRADIVGEDSKANYPCYNHRSASGSGYGGIVGVSLKVICRDVGRTSFGGGVGPSSVDTTYDKGRGATNKCR